METKMERSKEKVGKNVVHRRLQSQGPNPPREQSQDSNEEIAQTSPGITG
jgi:hypothetical protein